MKPIVVIEHDDDGGIKRVRVFQPGQDEAAMAFATKLVEQYYGEAPDDGVAGRNKVEAVAELQRAKRWCGWDLAVDIVEAIADESPPEPEEDEDASDLDRCACQECGTTVTRDDPYFATPCGTFCSACMEDKHSKECGICASEFDLKPDVDPDLPAKEVEL